MCANEGGGGLLFIVLEGGHPRDKASPRESLPWAPPTWAGGFPRETLGAPPWWDGRPGPLAQVQGPWWAGRLAWEGPVAYPL